MFKGFGALAMLGTCLVGGVWAQTPPKVDFARDIQPLFRQNCVGCHGPSQQINGLRLDRRSSVLKPGLRRVVPGSSANSFLYHRVSGAEFGLQMPPTGALKLEQIALVKAWIDQGAAWPDALANEADLPPGNLKAAAMVDALRAGNRQAFLKFAADDPKLLNARGPEGSTPFMYAVLYGDAALLEDLLKKGADPNARNDAQATALMWAATDIEKTRVLLAHGADVNAQSEEPRTPLMIAAGRPGNIAVVRLLLDRGANVNPTANPPGESSPLIQAALAADAESMQLLIGRGADLKAPGAAGVTLAMALTQNCPKCVDLVLKTDLSKDDFTGALQGVATFADASTVRMLLDRGGDVNAFDSTGRTPLMYAAASELLPVDVVKLLLERGADVNAKSKHEQSKDTGLTSLDMARWFGNTPVVDALLKAGAQSSGTAAYAAPKPRPAATRQAAIERSLPLLQRADTSFAAKSGCISCHDNSLTAMTAGLVRKSGLPVDERIASAQVKVSVAYLEHGRDSLHQGHFGQAGPGPFGDAFGEGVLAYVLIGLDAEHLKPNLDTDAVAMYLENHQLPEGSWIYTAADSRPPICSAYMGQTALTMRALQLYAPKAIQAEAAKSIQLAGVWLANTEPKSFEDRTWRVMGLAWSGANKDAANAAMRAVAALQRPDGGWSDMPTMASNAYTTGRALVALQIAGLPVSGPAYQRGVKYLLNTQLEDGSWYVSSRALGFQPYFDNGFPHGVDQFVSNAGTDWATMALALAAPATGVKTTAEALPR